MHLMKCTRLPSQFMAREPENRAWLCVHATNEFTNKLQNVIVYWFDCSPRFVLENRARLQQTNDLPTHHTITTCAINQVNLLSSESST